MMNLLAAVMLFALCIEMQDGIGVPANELFQITRASEIAQTGTTEKKIVFEDAMVYTFEGALSGSSFTITLNKHDVPETANSVFRYDNFIAFGGLSDNAFYNPTGFVSYNSQRWTIKSVNGTHYKGMRSDEESLSSLIIINEAKNLKRGVKEPDTRLKPKSYSLVRRDMHERHRRSVTTTCNIFEIVAVADATVWEYFLERNNGNETSAEVDLRLHYNALLRENESTDWTLSTAMENVDLVSSIPRCALFNTAGADAPFCFTRIDANVLSCTTNPSVNNTFRADDSASTAPPDPTDYSITYTLSNCSVDFLSARIEQLNNQSNNCLLQGNLTDEVISLIVAFRSLAGQKVGLNHQCQLAFGIDSYACDLYNSTAGVVIPNTAICGAGAFCTNNGTCGINQTIVYSGITCGCNQICYKGICRPDFDCGGLPVPPNGFFTSSDGSGFRSRAFLNCFPGTNTTTNVTIKCLRDGWQAPSENCTSTISTTTTIASTTPTTTDFVIFPG